MNNVIATSPALYEQTRKAIPPSTQGTRTTPGVRKPD